MQCQQHSGTYYRQPWMDSFSSPLFANDEPMSSTTLPRTLVPTIQTAGHAKPAVKIEALSALQALKAAPQ
eukprot:CAMPEP_0174350920 /NCGR_PEP_ID=MMETSP0811_2-20130205/8137_1 /TAXON_ID=73025 ORGANISM="Eutreptiella gymnastica-like, Strain CCMP1594" /NCGR_SAMPLE_ID=MMETSP0811_2 /ASSEMBLY_ACC=CAM_ASM_000667 /LENGTH=69 /DNA_ID=CAMNT_0015479671 /DNA_START=679 /DNA_END=885 /DNA_ORIENTATION=+